VVKTDDDTCGCVSEPAVVDSAATPEPAPPSTKPTAVDGSPPIACTLHADSMEDRLDDWRAVLAHVERREPIDGGVRASFGRSVPLEELVHLAAAEQDCCQFFEFAITIDGRGVALEVRAPLDALPIVYSLFGR